MIDFINQYRLHGYNKWRAILKGGSVRLRPIILTSVTTVCGLIPMAIGLGGKSPIWHADCVHNYLWVCPPQRLLTVFVMPALYAITADIRELFIRRERVTQPVFDNAALIGERAD